MLSKTNLNLMCIFLPLSKRRFWKVGQHFRMSFRCTFQWMWVLVLGYKTLKGASPGNAFWNVRPTFQNLRLGSIKLWNLSIPNEDFGRRNKMVCGPNWVLSPFKIYRLFIPPKSSFGWCRSVKPIFDCGYSMCVGGHWVCAFYARVWVWTFCPLWPWVIF